jgi:hypothetical protein
LRRDAGVDPGLFADANGTLSNPQSGRWIDSPGGNPANGTRLQIRDRNGTGAQTLAKA